MVYLDKSITPARERAKKFFLTHPRSYDLNDISYIAGNLPPTNDEQGTRAVATSRNPTACGISPAISYYHFRNERRHNRAVIELLTVTDWNSTGTDSRNTGQIPGCN